MSEKPTTVSFDALFDPDAEVWVATSRDRITTEAPTREALLERLRVIVPDVLEERLGAPASNLMISVNWQELRTVDHTDLMVA